jgi:NNP family nitrate/nitrite transporter-like MFS transporter
MPHMRAFHLSWISFFATFVSTFGPAALLTVVREDLDMTRTDIGNAGIAAVCGAVFGRVALGNFCDTFGESLACVRASMRRFTDAV